MSDKTEPIEVQKTEKEIMREKFFASKSLDWSSFCAEHGYNPNSKRQLYPVAEWVAEKKRLLAAEQADRIATSIFEHASLWHKETLRTLRQYPETCEGVHTLIRRRTDAILEKIVADQENRGKEGYKPQFTTVETKELRDLAAAAKLITEAKYRSLLLDRWNVGLTKEWVQDNQAPDQKPLNPNEERVDPTQWVVHLKGETIDGDNFRRTLLSYDDPPQTAPVEAAPTAEPTRDESVPVGEEMPPELAAALKDSG